MIKFIKRKKKLIKSDVKNIWISVKDNLPIEKEDGRSEMVETKLVDGSEMLGYRYNGGWCDKLGFGELGFPDCRVEYWRPIL
jgi:hypothetical protein